MYMYKLFTYFILKYILKILLYFKIYIEMKSLKLYVHSHGKKLKINFKLLLRGT